MSEPTKDGQATTTLQWRPRLSARLRLTLSYALFLVVAGGVMLAVIYLVMRYVPSYPLTSAHNPEEYVASRGEILDSLLAVSGLALVLLTIIGLGGGWVIAGQILRPLQRINEAARRAASGSLDHRIGLSGTRDEFTDLSETFDAMLDRLQASFRIQQRFAMNASHELRTPLAITKTMLDVAIADPDGQDYRQLTARLRETNQRGIEVVEALLQLSAIGRATLELAPADLAVATFQALTMIRDEATTRGVTVTADLRPAPTIGHRVLLRQLAMNLLENAVRYNTADGGFVTVSTGADLLDPKRVLLTVVNDGAVVDGRTVETLLEAFTRGNGRIVDNELGHRGHGLGLALVARVVDEHAGELSITARAEGGLVVRVSLPVA